MKFTVHYIDDQSHPLSIEANNSRMAAWKFLTERPRSDTSQITVESQPEKPWQGSEMIHYRACDLLTGPVPTDEGTPELAFRIMASRDNNYVLSGSLESLRLFASRILRDIEEFPTRPNPFNLKNVSGFSVIPGDGSRKESYLSFEADPDLDQYWNARQNLRGFWTEYGRCLAFLLLLIFAVIGICTVARWVF